MTKSSYDSGDILSDSSEFFNIPTTFNVQCVYELKWSCDQKSHANCQPDCEVVHLEGRERQAT